MTRKLLTATVILCSVLFIQTLQIKAQCPSSNLVVDWTFSTDISGGDDIAWDIEPIDDQDQDTIKDDGFIAVGETFADDSLKRQALIIRLKPNGTIKWEVIRGGNQNDVAYAVEQASNGNFIVCGTTKSTKFGTRLNANVWFFELDLDGNYVPGSEHEYGGSGNDNGYDIKQSPTSGFYVMAGGTGNVADGDLSVFSSTGINAAGEYWVLAIDPTDYHIVSQNIYHGLFEDPNGTGTDFARGLLIDHNSDYLLSGYCTSCGLNKTQMQSMVIKIASGGDMIWRRNFGDFPNSRDQGSHKVIETYDASTSTYQYLLTGVNHPDDCFNAHLHDSYVVKLKDNGGNVWTGGCQVDAGLTYGGSKKDDGLGAVQTCDGGYLIAGDSYSPSNNFDVTCNHSDAGTSDAWLYKLNSSGELEWDASFGDVNNDAANSIKHVPDGSYVIAGELGTEDNGQDFYVVKFKLAATCAAACAPPTGLQASTNGCKALLSWDMNQDVQGYTLRYKETSASDFTVISPVISPYIVNGTVGGSDKYKWTVEARCSKNVSSDPSQGPAFNIPGCKIENEDDANSEIADLISVYPNPSDGSFALSLQLNNEQSQQVNIEILDQVGKVVSVTEATIEKGWINEQLSSNDLPSGFYWIRIFVEGKAYQTKLVVQKT